MLTYSRRQQAPQIEHPITFQEQCQETDLELNPIASIAPSSSGDLFSDLDEPIVLKKGTQTCTQYPLNNYLSYTKFSPVCRSLSENISSSHVPSNINEALEIPEWRATIMEEVKALKKNGIWEVMQLPKEKCSVGCKMGVQY